MPDRSAITFREAVLSSLLVHAGLLIYLLIFPDAFAPPRGAQGANRDPNRPIPVAFRTEADLSPAPPEAAARLGDSGTGLSSDPRPESAPPPENAEPYALGNNPNQFLAPPVTSPPTPDPGLISPPESGTPKTPPAGEESESGSRAEEPPNSAEEGFRVARARPGDGERGEGEGEHGADSGSLRQTLGQMSLGLTGGAPLRFDNPVGSVSGPHGGLSFDTVGFNWGPYARKIYWIIWTNWTQGWPPAAWAGMKGVVTVRFRIWKDGRVTDISIVDASGTEAFDICARVALEASSPLPPLPDDFPKESEGITARFLYNLNTRDLPR